ncbi:hypothetical protein [Hymenobacter volaticus]|uniref:Uncharacterized protein n=1 Tax=Hymenobacter volaticus TaxID=2932254 RepID=A0ABY4GDQ2_9BACT|nr:hypothetical protein [Hymenobacter volaticus]UOQ68915.1 hypothetical protein MUN86_24735 [Hymenobacter volaticus]
MAKDKKNSSSKELEKKNKKGKKSKPAPAAEGFNGLLAQFNTVKDLRRQVGELSTGQVVVGGVALLAAGLTYWAKQRANTPSVTSVAPTASPVPASNPAVEEQQDQVETAATVAPKRKAKARKKAE